MIVATTLRSHILELLDGLVGTYRYSDGYTEPAIAVIPDNDRGYEVPGNSTRTEGIEVIIQRPVPQINHFLNGGKQFTYRWVLVLKQWDASKSLIEVVSILIEELDYLLSSPKLVPPNAALGIIEQCSFSIVEFEYRQGK